MLWMKKYIMRFLQHFKLCLNSRYRASLLFIWSHVSGCMTNVSPIFRLILALIASPSIPEGNVWPFSC